MSQEEDEVAIEVNTINDALKDGHWYHVLNPNNPEVCEAQVVRWSFEYNLWDCITIYDTKTDDMTAYLLLEDGTRFSDHIMV